MTETFGPPLPLDLLKSESLDVSLASPMVVVVGDLGNKIRTLEPITNPLVTTGFAIVVKPKQIDSPNVIKIVVTRDGVQIPPTKSTLAPERFEQPSDRWLKRTLGSWSIRLQRLPRARESMSASFLNPATMPRWIFLKPGLLS